MLQVSTTPGRVRHNSRAELRRSTGVVQECRNQFGGLGSSPEQLVQGRLMLQDHHLRLISLSIPGRRPSVAGEIDLTTAATIEAWFATFDVEPIDIDLSRVTF